MKGLQVMKGLHVVFRMLVLVPVLLLAGCSWLDSLSKEDNEKPLELDRIEQEVRLRKEWSVNVGDGQGEKFNRLKPAISGDRIYAASNNGVVVAVDIESGRTQWKLKTGRVITGGVGASNGLVLVGTESARVIAFSEEDGTELWNIKVSSEVLAAPATNGRVVVVQTVDGNLIGLDAKSGEQLWIYETNVPALSLRGTSSPLIIDNFAISALANGTVISIAIDNGTLRWEERVAIPTGRSEIDRLVDIDGDVVINDAGLVLAPSYQGYLAGIDVVTGQTRWRVEESSYVGAGFGFGNIYSVDDEDRVKAYRTGQETTAWINDKLLRRQVSTPLSFSNYVAVGDEEGYVHLLSQVDGRFVGRTKVDGDGVRARMLNQGNTLYVYGNSGKLVALRVE
jgi:outer membrane protein assembly factor BamB